MPPTPRSRVEIAVAELILPSFWLPMMGMSRPWPTPYTVGCAPTLPAHRMHALIHHLVHRHRLDRPQALRLWQLARWQEPPVDLARRLERALTAVAALLLGAALIFWVAANWPTQTRAFKIHLLQAAVLLPALLALLHVRWRGAWLLLATLALGGLLALVGQAYQTGADPWQLFAAWALLTLPWALAARSDGLWAAWTLVAALALLLWTGFDPGRSELPRGWTFTVLGPLLALLLFLLPLGLERLGLARAARASLAWRAAALVALAYWTAHGLLQLTRPGTGGVYFLDLALVVAATVLAWRLRPRDYVVLALALLALETLVWLGVAWLMFQDGGGELGKALLLTLVAAASVGAGVTWLVRLQRADRPA